MPTQYDHALLMAVDKGDIKEARNMLIKKANVETQDEDGSRPLHLAAGLGNLEMVKLLISYNANVEAKAVDNSTPLIDAVRYSNNIEVVKILLANHANINAETKAGFTALHFAVSDKKTAMEKLLLEYIGIIETSKSTEEYNIAFQKLNLKHQIKPDYSSRPKNQAINTQNIVRHTMWYKKPELVIPAALAVAVISAVVVNIDQISESISNAFKP